MIYSPKLNLLFVHIPKTGGTTFRQVMRSIDPDCYKLSDDNYFHSPLTSAVKQKMGAKVVTIVRNPVDRCISVWRYQAEGHTKTRKCQDLTFYQHFMKHTMDHRSVYPSQAAYFYDGNERLADYVLRFEHLESDIKNLFKVHLNIEVDVPHKKHIGPLPEINDHDRQLVKKTCKRDMELFGYD